MPHWDGKKPLRMECPHCGEIGEHGVVKTDSRNYYCGAEMAKLFERTVGRDIYYRRRIKKCSFCQKQFDSVEMPEMFFRAMTYAIKNLKKESEQLQIEKGRLATKVKIETNTGEELRTANENLEKQVRQLQAELDYIKEALLLISDMTVELGTRKPMPQYITDSPNKTLQLTGSP